LPGGIYGFLRRTDYSRDCKCEAERAGRDAHGRPDVGSFHGAAQEGGLLLSALVFATAGSVDDGKSTLIGRLLYDARALPDDQLAALERASARRGVTGLDLSLATDGLEAEREQGITIDVAYRYFSTPRRKFIIADSPGHEQYTRNMATAASNADALVLLVDATRGLLPQTRRHLAIARLMGITQIVAFVNKMDLAGWSREVFERLDLQNLNPIPGSALLGDSIISRSTHLPWYHGPTLLERLERFEPKARGAASGPLRFPVQLASRPVNGTARGYMGRVESGRLAVGDEVSIFPGGRRTRVRQIVERDVAIAGDSVTLMLEHEIDLSRGDLIAGIARPPREARSLEATLVWLGREPLRSDGRYLVQQASRRTRARVESEAGLGPNDIGRAVLSLQAPLFVDRYDAVRATGAFIVIEEGTNQTVAAGLVR
jgi:sulfate adenylyltransferase subunit 1